MPVLHLCDEDIECRDVIRHRSHRIFGMGYLKLQHEQRRLPLAARRERFSKLLNPFLAEALTPAGALRFNQLQARDPAGVQRGIHEAALALYEHYRSLMKED